jgi:hypothetical protein
LSEGHPVREQPPRDRPGVHHLGTFQAPTETASAALEVFGDRHHEQRDEDGGTGIERHSEELPEAFRIQRVMEDQWAQRD